MLQDSMSAKHAGFVLNFFLGKILKYTENNTDLVSNILRVLLKVGFFFSPAALQSC